MWTMQFGEDIPRLDAEPQKPQEIFQGKLSTTVCGSLYLEEMSQKLGMVFVREIHKNNDGISTMVK